MKKAFYLFFLMVFLTSCSGRPAKNDPYPSDIRFIRDIPVYADTNYQCGPSSLAAVMNYWHTINRSSSHTSPEIISAEIYSKGAKGTLGMDLELYAKRNGFQTMQYSGSLDDIKINIIKEIPLIILVDYGLLIYQRNHFLVVTGYNLDGVIVHSGSDEKKISFSELDKIWRKTNYWTLVIRSLD